MAQAEGGTERQRADEALRDAEEFQRRLIACSQDCIKVLDLEGRLLWMNEGGMQALEICDLGPFVNGSWIAFWEGEDAKAAQAAVETARNGGTGRFTGYFATTRTRQPRWWDVVVSPIRDAGGKPERLLAVSRDVTEYRHNEEALREAHLQVAASEGRWRSVFENSAIGVALTDLEGLYLAVNPVYQQMVGYNEEELRGHSFLEITHEEHRATNWALITELLEGKRKQFQIEKQSRRKDGSAIWVRGNVSLVPDTEGAPRFLLALAEDITERKQTEEALRGAHLQVARSEERWRSVFENSAIGVALTDLEGRFLAVNPIYQKMVGYSEEELRGLSFLEITQEEHREANWALAKELIEGKREQFQVEKPYRRKDGSWIWVRNNVSLVPGTETTPRFVMALSEDITERKTAEEALRKSEERVRLILDSTAEGIFGCDPQGTCLFCNPAAMRILGYDDTSEVLGRNMHALEHHSRPDGTPYPLEECPIYIGFQNGEDVHRDDEVYWRKDGTSFPVEFWSHIVFKEGKTIGAVITFVDITERKRAEEALRKSERLKRSLLEINNAIITNLTEEALLRSISETVRPAIPFDRCAITLYTPETDTIRFLAVEGALRSDYFHSGREEDRTETSIGWVFDHQQPLRRNLEQQQEFANEKRLWAEGLRSLCIVPLILWGKSIGTFSVVSRKSDAYSEEDAQFLQEVASQVALAVENMKSYEEIERLKARLEKENVYLREEIRTEHNFEEIVGHSAALLAVLRTVEQVAPTDSTVLIYGETGTGKELIARAIHHLSARKDRALVSVNCSAISAGLVESELFGHLKGAFTGAVERRIGRFELAHGGTIFLDEIGELPLETQVKLLRVLQEQEFEPVGSSRTQRVDVRVIAATNRNLREQVEAGRFRSDLFYRLNVLPIALPPLRERRSDIPGLVALFVARFAKRFGKNVQGVSQETMDRLISYPWPGNIRELQNVMERAVVLSAGPTLRLDKDLVPVVASGESLEPAEIAAQAAAGSPSVLPTLEEMERVHILAALDQAGGVVDGPKGAAKILNLHPNTLRHRMSKLGIKRPPHRQP